jgi:hypothetical protein
LSPQPVVGGGFREGEARSRFTLLRTSTSFGDTTNSRRDLKPVSLFVFINYEREINNSKSQFVIRQEAFWRVNHARAPSEVECIPRGKTF